MSRPLARQRTVRTAVPTMKMSLTSSGWANMQRFRDNKRHERGSTLLLVTASLLTVVFVLALGLSVYAIAFAQQRLEQSDENLAMHAAELMNKGDRSGQMNNMVAASRELVFNSRITYQQISQ